jgi:hypothetical protein
MLTALKRIKTAKIKIKKNKKKNKKATIVHCMKGCHLKTSTVSQFHRSWGSLFHSWAVAWINLISL